MMPDNILFDNIVIIGPGLIGSSLARAIRENKLAKKITGYDHNQEIALEAKSIGVIDGVENDLGQAIAGADLIILATPVGAIDKLCTSLNAHAGPQSVVMDVGSIKGAITRAAQTLREDIYFVPAHPIAGTEQSGPAAGFASLFVDRWCILTPLERDDKAYRLAVARIETLWLSIGSMVEKMDADHHDLALAITSHLPHLIAFTLVGAADDLESVNEAEIIKYSAGGFRDFTRIAASDPTMWRDVFLNNKEAVLEVLGRFTEELAVLQRAIRWGDGDKLSQVFTRGRALRQAIVEAGQETDEPNFGRDG